MKVSIITVVFNGEKTIEDTILSVASQSYTDIEHIVIDGFSTDSTMNIVNKHKDKINVVVSEPDKGIYDAMNKGILLASGHIIGLLNSDDVYYNENCVSAVVDEFYRRNVQAVCGDLVYVDPGNLNKIVRYYKSERFKPYMFAYGIMPAHPACFVKKVCYQKLGLFKIDYSISADFELMARFLKRNRVSFYCFPKVLVKMRTGGVSTQGLKHNWILNKEIIRACKENKIKTNMPKVLLKYCVKVFQLFSRPSVSGQVKTGS